MGLFFGSWAWPLSSSERNSECFRIPIDFWQFLFPNFVETVWGWPVPVPTWLRTSAQSKVHKDMHERVWCGRTWLACSESWPQPNRTALGWIRAETVSQAFSSKISVWPHKCHIKPYGLRMGCNLSSYVCKGRWTNTFGNIVYVRLTVTEMWNITSHKIQTNRGLSAKWRENCNLIHTKHYHQYHYCEVIFSCVMSTCFEKKNKNFLKEMVYAEFHELLFQLLC